MKEGKEGKEGKEEKEEDEEEEEEEEKEEKEAGGKVVAINVVLGNGAQLNSFNSFFG